MKLFQGLNIYKLLHLAEGPAVDQNLAALSFTAEASGKVGNVANRVIVDSALEADISDGGVTGSQADAEIQVVSLLKPTLAQFLCARLHLDGHEHSLLRVIGARNRVIEENHDPVSGKTH